MRRRLAWLAPFWCWAASPLAAQVSRTLAVGVAATAARFRAAEASGAEALSGIAVGGMARLSVGPAALEAFYTQGRLLPDTGSPAARDLVEGGVLLAVRPVHWLVLRGGPHLRAFVVPGGTERWTFGEVRARFEGGIIGTTVRTHVELWRALASDVNVPRGAGSAQGGEVGLTIRLPQAPLWARLAYGIDRAKLKDGSRTETLEAVALMLGFGGQ